MDACSVRPAKGEQSLLNLPTTAYDMTSVKAAWLKDKAGWWKAEGKEAWAKYSKMSNATTAPEVSSFGMHAEAAAYQGRPLRILCLHGMGGNANHMTTDQLSQLKEYCGPLVEFIGVDAPHPMGGASGAKAESIGTACAWFPQTGGDWAQYWARSLQTLQDAIETHGPFDGLLGFSMGAACAPLLLAHVPEGTFEFMIVCDGYPPGKDGEAQFLLDALERQRPIKTPTLFTMSGEPQWAMVGEMVTAYFDPAVIEVRKHEGWHDVPRDEESLGQMAAFLLNQARRMGRAGI